MSYKLISFFSVNACGRASKRKLDDEETLRNTDTICLSNYYAELWRVGTKWLVVLYASKDTNPLYLLGKNGFNWDLLIELDPSMVCWIYIYIDIIYWFRVNVCVWKSRLCECKTFICIIHEIMEYARFELMKWRKSRYSIFVVKSLSGLSIIFRCVQCWLLIWRTATFIASSKLNNQFALILNK